MGDSFLGPNVSAVLRLHALKTSTTPQFSQGRGMVSPPSLEGKAKGKPPLFVLLQHFDTHPNGNTLAFEPRLPLNINCWRFLWNHTTPWQINMQHPSLGSMFIGRGVKNFRVSDVGNCNLNLSSTLELSCFEGGLSRAMARSQEMELRRPDQQPR